MEKNISKKRNILNSLLEIKYPVITEKSTNLKTNNIYTFIIEKKLTKKQIKKIFEYLFNIKIFSVNTLILPKKKRKKGRIIGYRSQYKKVYIKLNKEQSIQNIFD